MSRNKQTQIRLSNSNLKECRNRNNNKKKSGYNELQRYYNYGRNQIKCTMREYNCKNDMNKQGQNNKKMKQKK